MTARLTICGLGPGGPGHLTTETRAALAADVPRFVRTARHPTAELAGDAETFDDLYDGAETFDQVYSAIVDRLLAASADGPVLYVVPGSPLVLEESVRRLRTDDRIEVDVLPGLSFLDLAWARLGIDPVDAGVRLVDGHRFATEAAGERGPLLVAHAHAPWVLSEVKLASEPSAGDPLGGQPVTVLQGLGTTDERIVEVAWDDLDRAVEPDHLTTLYIPEMAAPVARELASTVTLMHRLRHDCPWDREQDHQSLRRYLMEESYEVLDAIDALPGGAATADSVDTEAMAAYADLEEELGDLWFQILFHAELAAEAGQFTIADVARTLHEKLVRRHPHVFGEVEVDGTDQIVANWDRIKQEEKRRAGALDGIPMALPALALAAKLLSRARRSGAPVEGSALLGPVEPLPADADEAALGRFLLGLVAWASDRDLDAEEALRAAVLAARRRFEAEEAGDGVGPLWIRG
ncbi:MAG: MazG nucleotide pyrophosphohydrolase domain-containing protein [Actinomycetota bacterium]